MLKSAKNLKGEKDLNNHWCSIMECSENLKTIPPEELTYELCEQAVRNCGANLQYVPCKYKSLRICIDAINNDGRALEFVPLDFVDVDICEQAIKNNLEAYNFVPEELRFNPIFKEFQKKYEEKSN